MRLETITYATGQVRMFLMGGGKPIIETTGCECPVCGCHEVWAWEKQAELVDVDLIDSDEWDRTFYWEIVDVQFSCNRCEHPYMQSEIIAKRRELLHA